MSRKHRYIKVRLEMDLVVTDDFMKRTQTVEDFKKFALNNTFRNNARRVRHIIVNEIANIEYNAK